MKINENSKTKASSKESLTIGGGLARVGNVLRGGLLALTLCGSVAVSGLVASGHAEARVPDGPRFDSLSLFCGGLQDRRDAIWDEFSGASQARQQELMDELRGIMQTWVDVCQGTFGAIGVRLAPETTGVLVTGVDQMAPESATPPGKPASPASNRIRANRLAY